MDFKYPDCNVYMSPESRNTCFVSGANTRNSVVSCEVKHEGQAFTTKIVVYLFFNCVTMQGAQVSLLFCPSWMPIMDANHGLSALRGVDGEC